MRIRAPFTDNTRVKSEPAQDVALPALNKLHLLLYRGGICPLAQIGDYPLPGQPHEHCAAGVGKSTGGEDEQQDRGGLS